MTRWIRQRRGPETEDSSDRTLLIEPSSRWRWLLTTAAILLTAGALIAAFPRHEIPESAYVALVPFLSWILFMRPSGRAVFWSGWLSGWIQWVVLLWWLRHFPEQVGLSSVLGWGAVVLLSAVVGLFFAGWVSAARWAFEHSLGRGLTARVGVMLGLAGAWVVFEWIRAWLFTGFPWLPLAASQWQRPLLLQILPWTGAWGLSFILVLFNLGLVFYVRHFIQTRRQVWYKRLCFEFYLGLAAIFLTIGLGVADRPQGGEREMFRAGFVQPYVKPPTRWNGDNLKALQDDLILVCRYAAFDEAEVILWPEASTPWPAPGDPVGEQWLSELSAELKIPLLLGNLAYVPDAEGILRWYNAIVCVTPEGGVDPVFAAKRHLVPFGEYVPKWLPFLDKVVPLDGQLTPGAEAQPLVFPLNGRRWRVGALVCYEDVFPRLSRDLVRKGVDFLFVATNDAWYGEEGAAYQHAAHSVLRAVETRRPVLRSGNAGWSGWIDERGQIRHWLAGAAGTVYFQGADALTVSRHPWYVDRLTPFVKWGDWFVGVSGLLASGLLFLGLPTKR